MQIAVSDIDQIVRAVAQRLREIGIDLRDSEPALPGHRSVHPPALTTASMTDKVGEPGHLRLSERVVTIESLRGRLAGTKSIEVLPRAVVTPAVLDELRSKGIRLCRASIKSVSDGQSPHEVSRKTVHVAGTAAELDLLSSMVREQKIERIPLDGPEAAQAIVKQIRACRDARIIWHTSTPFADSHALHNAPGARVALLAHPGELAIAEREISLNVCVIRSGDWSIGGLTRLTKLFGNGQQ